MDQQRIDIFMVTHQKYFPVDKIPYIREQLRYADENKLMLLNMVEYKDPTVMLIVSIFFGYLGVDRFMLGDIGMGVLKLLTGGVCGILAIIDWFSITDKTKESNFSSIESILVRANTAANTATSTSFCGYCGAAIPSNTAFCPVCGKQLNYKQ